MSEYLSFNDLDIGDVFISIQNTKYFWKKISNTHFIWSKLRSNLGGAYRIGKTDSFDEYDMDKKILIKINTVKIKL